MCDLFKDPQQLKDNGGELSDVMDIFKELFGGNGADKSANSGGMNELLQIMGKDWLVEYFFWIKIRKFLSK